MIRKYQMNAKREASVDGGSVNKDKDHSEVDLASAVV